MINVRNHTDMKSIPSAWVLLLALLFVASCSDNDATTIWDPNVAPPVNPPEITSISPEGGYLAGIDAVTINGSGFAATPEDNRVFFSSDQERGLAATILSASANQLVIRPPQLVGENLDVFVGIFGSENFSNTLNYTLSSPLLPGYSTFNPEADLAQTLCIDEEKNLFIALTSGGNPQGIVKVNTQGENDVVSDYVVSIRPTWPGAIDFGPDDRLYITAGIRAVFIGIEGQRESPIFDVPSSFEFINFDFDDQGNMWLVGDNTHIFRHRPQESRVSIRNIDDLPDNTSIYPLEANLTGIKYFQNSLYVVGTDETSAKIWKIDLDNNRDIISINEFANLNTLIDDLDIESDNFNDLEIAEDGMMYIATNRQEGIIQVAADGTSASGLYPGVIFPRVTSMDWGTDEFLYISLNAPSNAEYTNNVLRVNMQKLSAPDF